MFLAVMIRTIWYLIVYSVFIQSLIILAFIRDYWALGVTHSVRLICTHQSLHTNCTWTPQLCMQALQESRLNHSWKCNMLNYWFCTSESPSLTDGERAMLKSQDTFLFNYTSRIWFDGRFLRISYSFLRNPEPSFLLW